MKTCDVCGKGFVPNANSNASRQKRCSQACSRRLDQRHRRERYSQDPAYRAKNLEQQRLWRAARVSDPSCLKRERERSARRYSNPEERDRRLESQRRRYAEDARFREEKRKKNREAQQARRSDPAKRVKELQRQRERSRERYANEANYRAKKRDGVLKQYRNNPACRMKVRTRSHQRHVKMMEQQAALKLAAVAAQLEELR